MHDPSTSERERVKGKREPCGCPDNSVTFSNDILMSRLGLIVLTVYEYCLYF